MNWNVSIFIIVINIFLSCGIYASEKIPVEIESFMEKVIISHETALEDTRQGLGRANFSRIVTTDNQSTPDQGGEIRFWFKGQSKRTDFHPLGVEPEDSNLQRSLADDGEFSYRYNKFVSSAKLDKADSLMRNDLGVSFHPNLFFEWLPGSSVSSMFKWMLDNKDKVKETFRMQVTENGYIKLTGTVRSDENGKNLPLTEYYIIFDPEKDYRITEYHAETKNTSGVGSLSIRSMKILWKDYGNGYMYPQKVHWERKSVASKERLESLSNERRIKEQEMRASINVKSFNHDVSISDDIFTLPGMGIEAGTKVNDAIKGILYKYGSEDQAVAVSKVVCSKPGCDLEHSDNAGDKTANNNLGKRVSGNITTNLAIFLCIIIVILVSIAYFVFLKKK